MSRSSVLIEENLIVHSLGLSWHSNTDIFQFIFYITSTENVAKRIVLSTIAKLYDPFGFFSPVIVGTKIMQEICENETIFFLLLLEINGFCLSNIYRICLHSPFYDG